MGRHKNQITFNKLDQAQKDLLGTGTGPNYRPFIQFGDFSSLGTNTRFVNPFLGRVHNALSQLELKWLAYLAFQEDTLDLQEQFPLITDRLTLTLADQYGIKHPAVRGEPIVMTTDILLTKRGGEKIAHSVKYSNQLLNRRVQEYMFLENKYWEHMGDSWGILTEKNLPPVVVNNILIITTYSLSGIRPEMVNKIAIRLTLLVVQQPSRPLFEIALDCDAYHGLKEGTSMNVVKHLLTIKRWKINLNRPFRTSEPLLLLGIE